jgi:hypothetical protein
LFEYVKTQNQSKLLELLSLAFDTMDTNQRHDVFGKTAKEVPPFSVDGEEILTTIEQFYEKSMAGYYYAPPARGLLPPMRLCRVEIQRAQP